jgi:Prealbumin-like fold domain
LNLGSLHAPVVCCSAGFGRSFMCPKPIKGVEMRIQTRNQAMVNATTTMQTAEDGHFFFSGLPRGEYRLRATIRKAEREIDGNGRPVIKPAVFKELRVESGKEDIRIELIVPGGGRP